MFSKRIPAVVRTVPAASHPRLAQWNATTMPDQVETSRLYANERVFRTDVAAMTLTGWRMVEVCFGPGRRRLIDGWRLKGRLTRTAQARYLRP